MRIGAVNNSFSFTQQKTTAKNDNNPISKSGEKAKLTKAAFIAGLGIGAKLLFEVMDGDFVVDTLGNKAEKIVDKQHKNVSKNKKALLAVGAWAGLIAAFIGGFAILYTLFKAPKINYEGNVNAFKKGNYEGNVNAFKKGKDMDVYVKGNSVEKELYTQMNEKAKQANEEEKAKLKEQYMQMKMAKNRVPDFVKLNR
ncbi:unknown [Clostridium sp. CAG:967]|nr:unknown [Clostridium sp. CAG:967]